MVRVLAANVVDRGCGAQSGQTKNYKIDIAKNGLAGIRIMGPSEWGDMSIHGLLFQYMSQHYKNPAKRPGLVQSGTHHYFIGN